MLSTKPVCDISYSRTSNRRSIRTRKCRTPVQRKLFCDMYRMYVYVIYFFIHVMCVLYYVVKDDFA